jgi:hypothetical protein
LVLKEEVEPIHGSALDLLRNVDVDHLRRGRRLVAEDALNFDLATWPELVQLARTAGPSAIIDQVRAAERSDPTGRRWPRGKSSDDATAAYAVCGPLVDPRHVSAN